MKGSKNKSKRSIRIILSLIFLSIVIMTLSLTVFKSELLGLFNQINDSNELVKVNSSEEMNEIPDKEEQTEKDADGGSEVDDPAGEDNTGIEATPTTQSDNTLSDISERIELRLGDKTENVEIGYIPEFDDMKSYYDIKAVYYSKDVPEGDYLHKDDIKWTTDNEDIADVRRGTVMPISEGTATITSEYNGLKDSITVIVKKDTFVEIELEYPDLVLDKDGINKSHSRIYTDVKTLYGNKFEITNREETHWTAQNGNVEIIDGGIRAKEVGKDIVTVEFCGLTTTLNVEVKDRKIKEIRLDFSEITMSYNKNGASETTNAGLSAELDDGTILDISDRAKWTSEDPLVAEVAAGDLVFIDAVGVGETLIHADYEDFHGTIKVIVEDATAGD